MWLNNAEENIPNSEIKQSNYTLHGLLLDTLSGESKVERQGSFTIMNMSASGALFHISSEKATRKCSSEQKKKLIMSLLSQKSWSWPAIFFYYTVIVSIIFFPSKTSVLLSQNGS